MSGWLLLSAWVWPLLLVWPATWQGGPSTGSPARDAPRSALPAWILPAVGPIPALIAALMVPIGTTLELPWLFLGTSLGLDAAARVYLLFTSILWLVAGIYAAFSNRGSEHAGRFNALFLLAMAGNLWLIVGSDMISFYVGFAIMGLSSYGLVIHDGAPSALRAGKVYLIMALLGEVSLFAALVMIASQTGSTSPTPEQLAGLDDLTIGLALAGLGVKAGLVPLHLWLPLAHPAAPIPASAVLSGTMIKVALLGWMRFLPVGAVALPEWGALLTAAGLLTLFFALPIGLIQSDPKVVLAYSSISKMGLLVLLLGVILTQPALAPLGVAAIVFYAANHALVKGGLFLGVGMRKHAIHQPLVLAALVFLALALAGLPFTSGAVAKYQIKPVLDAANWTWISAAVAVATLGTTLLMARFIWVSVRIEPHPEPGWLWPAAAWGVLIALAAVFPFALGTQASWLTNPISVPVGVGIAALIGLAAWRRPAWLGPLGQRLVGAVPPGDLLALIETALEHLRRLAIRLWQPIQAWLLGMRARAIWAFEQVFATPTGDSERALRAWPVAGTLWIGITAAMLVFVLAGQPLTPISTAADAGASNAAAELDAEEPASSPDQEPEPEQTDAIAAVPPTPPPSAPSEPPAEQPALQTQTEPPPSTVVEADRPEGAAADAQAQTDVAVSESEPSAIEDAETGRETPAPAELPVDEPAVDELAGTEPPITEPLDEPAPCDPPTPYLFATAAGDRLELERCTVGEAGEAELLSAPALSNSLVRMVQQALLAAGYDPGPIDGLIGPRTRAAVRQLQQDNGLTADGIISFAVLDLLQQ
jgi:formate hydrogenlyase subunit 3/multisubunit Na+/H+ antiporter MnhD subunit